MNGTIEENNILQVLKGKLNKIPDNESISKVYEAETQDDVEKIIDDIYRRMPDNSQKIVEINLATLGANLPLSSYRATICRFYEHYGFVELTSETYGRLFRTLHDDLKEYKWGEWEWNTPPLWWTVEYRLSERYNAVPLYTKAFETVWNAGSSVEINVPNISLVTNYSAHFGNIVLPAIKSSGEIVGVSITKTGDNTLNIQMHGESGATGQPLFVQIWYTKN